MQWVFLFRSTLSIGKLSMDACSPAYSTFSITLYDMGLVEEGDTLRPMYRCFIRALRSYIQGEQSSSYF